MRLILETWRYSDIHYIDAIMSVMASQIASVLIVYPTVCSGADQRKHQSSASLAFARGIHLWPVNTPRKGPVTRKMFPFDDVIKPDNKVHGANMGSTWDLSAPDGPMLAPWTLISGIICPVFVLNPWPVDAHHRGSVIRKTSPCHGDIMLGYFI